MRVELCNPTGRKTQAHIVTIGENEYFFSYNTCIAFRGMINGEYRAMRVANSWGPTTGRHFNELGCSQFLAVASIHNELDKDELPDLIKCIGAQEPMWFPNNPQLEALLNGWIASARKLAK